MHQYNVHQASSSQASNNNEHRRTAPTVSDDPTASHSTSYPSLSTPTGMEETTGPSSEEIINAFIDEELDTMSLRQLVEQISVEVTEVRAHQARQESQWRNQFDSLHSHIRNLENWGKSIAEENSYLRGELQRITEDYNSYYMSQSSTNAEVVDLRTRLDAHQARANQISLKLKEVSQAMEKDIYKKLVEVLDLCPSQ